jgi:hypothetical protein
VKVKVNRKPNKPTTEPPAEQAATQGQFLRPEAAVLPDEALVPRANLISPAPNQFTHELAFPQPFYYTRAQSETPPDGELPAATRVILMAYSGGIYCWVVDGQGLYVEIEYGGLRKL